MMQIFHLMPELLEKLVNIMCAGIRVLTLERREKYQNR